MTKLPSRVAVLLCAALTVSAGLAAEPFPSTYQVPVNSPLLVQGATVLTGTGERIDGADVLIENGRIGAVGRSLSAPAGTRMLNAQGRWVTPGLIDIHSHLGVYASPAVKGLDDGNEATSPNTANVWAEHSIWPQDPGLQTALEGGVTTLQILPGSANLIGGRSVVIKNVPAVTYQAMKFPGAAYGLKMACGENPKRVYGEKNQTPATRMGNVAGYRQAFADAQDYQQQWDKYRRDLTEYNRKKTQQTNGGKKPKNKEPGADKELIVPIPPKRDLKLETLAEVLSGNIRVHVHCYRSDEMATMLDVADEFGFKIAAFHHAVEAYKIADRLAQNGVCAAMWADWWGFKMEAFDGIQENLPMVDYPGRGCAIVHSDSDDGIQHLNQEAAKAMAHGVRVGLVVPPERAIRWLTSNPAKSLGLEDRIGTLDKGKAADLMLEQAIREARAQGPIGQGALLHAAGREAMARYLSGGRVVFQVDRAADILGVVSFARRNGMKPVISGGSEAWVVAKELAQADVAVILDPLKDLPSDFDHLGAALDNAARLQRAGVRIAFSSGDSYNARLIRQLAGIAVAHGLPWESALAAISANPAEIAGLGTTRGHIAVGQVADLVLWRGDPLEVTTLADQVWINGRPIEMRSRQTELRDRYIEQVKAHRAF